MLYIVSVGPGDPELITVKGLETIKKCQVVAGWGSVVDRFSFLLENKKVIRMTYKEESKQLEEIFSYAKNMDVAFLDHGDVAVSDYQLLEKIKKGCEKYNVPLKIIPGVSSVIRALHVVGKDLSEVVFLTFHVRGEINYDDIRKFLATGRGLLVNPEPYPDGVKRIALKLKEIGCNNVVLTVMEKLTYPDEAIHYYTVDDIINKDLKFSDLSIVYIPPCSFS